MTTTVDDDLKQLMHSLKLKRIAAILERELDHAQRDTPSYSAFLARLLRAELEYRKERSVEYRIAQARLPERYSIETFPFKRQPSVKPALIRELARLEFISKAANIVFIGNTGVGKTGLASALLLKAIQDGYRGLFIKAQDLFDEMYASLADRSTRLLLNRLARVDVLLIDEMGYLNLRPEQSNAFFKLMDERYGRRSTLITTNLQYDTWYDFLGKKEMVGALLDRIRHRCHTINIDGESLRSPEA
jgi:DNA replication protein DnaC